MEAIDFWLPLIRELTYAALIITCGFVAGYAMGHRAGMEIGHRMLARNDKWWSDAYDQLSEYNDDRLKKLEAESARLRERTYGADN